VSLGLIERSLSKNRIVRGHFDRYLVSIQLAGYVLVAGCSLRASGSHYISEADLQVALELFHKVGVAYRSRLHSGVGGPSATLIP
jgi:hypothetical protein